VTESPEAPQPALTELAPRPRGFVRRGVFELLGLSRYSRPALHGIDRKLERYLAFDAGYFVEAGANDGYTQSNTYYLERFRKWRGVLVEPLPALFERCRRERPRSRVFRCALVAGDYEAGTASMLAANLTSLVRGAQKSPEADEEHCRAGARIQDTLVSEFEVPARTLTSVLDEAGAGRVDFLSLDVEGYELQALNGLDIERFRPRFVLVEARFRDEIDRRLNPYYDAVDELTHHDVLYRWKDR
jgi:FkbM family methyltransferase